MRNSEIQILIVDDDKIDVRALSRAFEQLKIANPLRVAGDGQEALEILRGQNGHVPLKKPYIILLDLNMPRMSGLEFLAELRIDPDHHNATVFVLTTSSADEDIIGAYEKNVAGYVIKSDAAQSFIEAIDALDHFWRIIELPSR